MTPEKFVDLVGYKPRCITAGLEEDPVRLIFFRDWKNFSATVEFGTEINKKMKGYYFYFEILDLNGYREADFIPLNSARRHNVILKWPKKDEEYIQLADMVRNSLKKMYSRRREC